MFMDVPASPGMAGSGHNVIIDIWQRQYWFPAEPDISVAT